MYEITSQPLYQTQHEQVRLARGREDIRERWVRCLCDQYQTTSQDRAINQDPAAPIFEMGDLGIVGDAREIVPRLSEDMKRQRAGA